MKRFWDKVEKTDGCWNWTAATAGRGYGVIRMSNPRRMEYAHRLSYQMSVGEIPEGMMVLHSCDNPRCVNPEHLRPGSQTENMADMDGRGRRNSASKLTTEQVREIRRRLSTGETHRSIASDYDVVRETVSQIARGRNWKDVE